jgi:hypothetical protein
MPRAHRFTPLCPGRSLYAEIPRFKQIVASHRDTEARR